VGRGSLIDGRCRVFVGARFPERTVVRCPGWTQEFSRAVSRRVPCLAVASADPAEGPHGLWLDGGRLLCAADGGALVVLDRKTGSVVKSLPLPGVPDVVMFDPDG
jgi:hypothetical protein